VLIATPLWANKGIPAISRKRTISFLLKFSIAI